MGIGRLPDALPPAECPFCGGTANKCIHAKRKGVQVECINCGARGPIYADNESAFNGWRYGKPFRRNAAPNKPK